MPDLDDRHLALRRRCREWAADLRAYGQAAERDPSVVYAMLDLPAVRLSAMSQVPPPYRQPPLVIDGHEYYLVKAIERAIFAEAVACADLGIMLALPGASMCGTLVNAIGDAAQRDWFYSRVLERPTWTFFALTEPEGGSDAGALHTCLREQPGSDGLVLNGVKRYVSNALRASVGAVFFRHSPGPLGVGAALVETTAPGFSVTAIDTIAVRAAQLGVITLDSVRIAPNAILGGHLPPVRRGGWGWLRTFNLLRPAVASMGVGVAQAAHDYATAGRRMLSGQERDLLDRMDRRIESVRHLALAAAIAVDRDPGNGHLASVAKLSAVTLARETVRQAVGLFGTGARLDHPVLDKLARDARALEFMEGTGNIQKLGISGALLRGAADAVLTGQPM